jgi:hypothetical protein
MSESSIQYVGPPELNCGHVVGVYHAGDRATVRVRDADGRYVSLEFAGVVEFDAMRPEGMLLHGVAELRPADRGDHRRLRRFVFANEEEWDDAYLEIAAEEFWVDVADRQDPTD